MNRLDVYDARRPFPAWRHLFSLPAGVRAPEAVAAGMVNAGLPTALHRRPCEFRAFATDKAAPSYGEAAAIRMRGA